MVTQVSSPVAARAVTEPPRANSAGVVSVSSLNAIWANFRLLSAAPKGAITLAGLAAANSSPTSPKALKDAIQELAADPRKLTTVLGQTQQGVLNMLGARTWAVFDQLDVHAGAKDILNSKDFAQLPKNMADSEVAAVRGALVDSSNRATGLFKALAGKDLQLAKPELRALWSTGKPQPLSRNQVVALAHILINFNAVAPRPGNTITQPYLQKWAGSRGSGALGDVTSVQHLVIGKTKSQLRALVLPLLANEARMSFAALAGDANLTQADLKQRPDDPLAGLRRALSDPSIFKALAGSSNNKTITRNELVAVALGHPLSAGLPSLLAQARVALLAVFDQVAPPNTARITRDAVEKLAKDSTDPALALLRRDDVLNALFPIPPADGIASVNKMSLLAGVARFARANFKLLDTADGQSISKASLQAVPTASALKPFAKQLIGNESVLRALAGSDSGQITMASLDRILKITTMPPQ